MKYFYIIICSLLLVGCQNTATDQQLNSDADSTAMEVVETKEVVNRGIPYTTTPTYAPEDMVQPTEAPGTSTSTSVQAVTTDEKIKLTLPRKVE